MVVFILRHATNLLGVGESLQMCRTLTSNSGRFGVRSLKIYGRLALKTGGRDSPKHAGYSVLDFKIDGR